MGAETLQTELLGVPGVSAAEIDAGAGAIPAGVKVSLSPDADARRVGIEVQRILAAHGMRSRFSSSKDDPPSTLPTEASPPTPPVPESPPPPVVDSSTAPQPVAVSVEPAPDPPPNAPPSPSSIPELRSVSVEERVDGLTASVVLSNGRAASRTIGADVGAEQLHAAIVGAVAEAAGEAVTAKAIEWLQIDERTVVTVVVERDDGSLGAGAGVTRFGRAFAVGTATRSALQS
ncbi:MAG: hypothetical protein V3U50_04385 [Acidimicrobiia bacterium]